MKSTARYFGDTDCNNVQCRFCDGEKKECTALKDTSKYKEYCPFFKQKGKER